MRRFALVSAFSVVFLAGCQALALLLQLAELLLLGAIPAFGFSDADSPEYGVVHVSLGSAKDDGTPVLPPKDLLEVDAGDDDVDLEDSTDKPGYTSGSMVLLSDGSGSVADTDPQDFRKEAVRILAEELHGCGPAWRVALMEFGASGVTDGFDETWVHQDFTTDTDAIQSAADALDSSDWTPLWQSTYEVLASLDVDAKDAWEQGEAGSSLVVLSDGADTTSTVGVDDVIARAKDLGIPVHTIGFGPASDLDAGADTDAVRALQQVSSETGGFYGYVSSAEELPDLASNIARSTCGGYAELTLRFANPPPSGELVEGNIGVVDTNIKAPFSFRAP